MPLKANYKTVKVLAYCTKEDDYRNWDLSKQNFIKKLAKNIEYYASEPIEYIDLRIPNDVYVKLNSVLIRLGTVQQTSFDETLKRITKLPSLLPQVKLLNKKIKYLDLRWEKVYYIKLDE